MCLSDQCDKNMQEIELVNMVKSPLLQEQFSKSEAKRKL